MTKSYNMSYTERVTFLGNPFAAGSLDLHCGHPRHLLRVCGHLLRLYIRYIHNEPVTAQSTYIPGVPQCLSPSWNWDPPPPLPLPSVIPPGTLRGGGGGVQTRLRVGESQFGRLERK
jgi:hypothetical protein